MTNSIIPHSFVPGTKAKAGEINANFEAIAEVIVHNNNLATSSIANLQENLNQQIEGVNTVLESKADQSDMFVTETVANTDTDLNDYKTYGSYIFDEEHTPLNIPKGTSGTLFVSGTEETEIRQIWYTDSGEMLTRSYKSEVWSDWSSSLGYTTLTNPGYMKLSNGMILQWGYATSYIVTYPVAFKNLACVIFSKKGQDNGYERSDTGITYQALTGFRMDTCGVFHSVNWIVLGY